MPSDTHLNNEHFLSSLKKLLKDKKNPKTSRDLNIGLLLAIKNVVNFLLNFYIKISEQKTTFQEQKAIFFSFKIIYYHKIFLLGHVIWSNNNLKQCNGYKRFDLNQVKHQTANSCFGIIKTLILCNFKVQFSMVHLSAKRKKNFSRELKRE